MKLTNKLAHYGDMVAIPFFLISIIYFYRIENKTTLENIILIFLLGCFIFDLLFTYIYLSTK